MRFDEDIIFDNYELTIIGNYNIAYGIVDHVGWIVGGEIIDEDVRGEFVRIQDVEILEVYCEEIRVNLPVDQLKKIQKIIARILTEGLYCT